MKINYVIPCLMGVESLIAQELREMEAEDVRAENARVLFRGDEQMLARVNINARFAERLQILVGSFEAKSFEELFEGTKALPWELWLNARDAFPVKGYSLGSDLFSVRDCQSIIKKAVVERMKQKYHVEWFEESGAVHQVQFSIMKNTVSLLLDTTGAGLHKRGYRLDANEAPMKETLAAALCEVSKLRPYHKLYDPMCGSGTILIEGAMLCKKIAPGLNRSFAAERWELLTQEQWQQERERAKALEQKAEDFFACGSDIDGAALENAQRNAERAGVADCIRFTKADIRDFTPQSEKGTLICNPPYGERLMDIRQAEQLYTQMGEVFERRHGWSYGIISPSKTFEQSFGRTADKRRKLYNGMIQCNLFMYFRSGETIGT